MPLTTSTVSGYLTKPNGEKLKNGIAVFTLSGVATSDNHITSSQEVVVETASDGFFSVDLMPNSAYPYPTSYALVGYEYIFPTDRRGRAYAFGSIRVPETDSDIEDLIPVTGYGTRNTATVIRGDTIVWYGVYVDDIGHPIDITDYTVTYLFRHQNGEEHTGLADLYGASNGNFLIETQTDTFSLGQYDVRLSFESDGFIKTQSGKLEVKN